MIMIIIVNLALQDARPRIMRITPTTQHGTYTTHNTTQCDMQTRKHTSTQTHKHANPQARIMQARSTQQKHAH